MSDHAPLVPARDVDEARAARVVGLLAVFSVINFGDKAVIGLAGPSIISDLGLTNTRFGTVNSAFYLLFSISAVLTAVFAEQQRVPPARLLTGMALVWSAAQLPLLLPSAGFATLVATRVVLGAGEGPSLPMANHVAFTWYPPQRRTTVAGVITLGGAVGVIVGGPALAAVIALAGWRWAFGLLGALGVAWCLVWNRAGDTGGYSARPEPEAPSPPEARSASEAPPPPEGPSPPEADVVLNDLRDRIPLRRILGSPTWIVAAFAGFTGNWVLGLGLSWLAAFLERRAGYPATTVGFLIGLPSLVALVAVPLVMYLAHRRRRAGRSSRSTYALLGFGAAAVPAAGLLAMTLGEAGYPLLIAVSIAFGAGIALAPLVSSAIADLVPADRRGVALCSGTAVASLGAVVSPWVTGRLLDLATNEAAGFDVAFRLAAALALAGGVSLLFLDPERDGARLRSARAGS